MDSRTKLLGGIDLAVARGLEIGPLHNPRLRKDEADVRYLDHMSSADLRTKYRDNADLAPLTDQIVDVDYIWTPGRRLAEVVEGATFDFVIASHVVEHIPDLVGWLGQVAEILVEGGLFLAVIPDKRYCFDVNRGVTTVGDFVDAYLRGAETPSYRQIYDHEVNFLPVDTARLWAGAGVGGQRRSDVPDADVFAFECCVEQRKDGATYRDVHCSTFTPESFLGVLDALARLGLSPFALRSFHPTEHGELEFFATLVKVAGDTVGAERTELIRSSIRPWLETPADSATPELARVLEVSPAEERLLQVKRRLLTRARQVLARRPAG